MGRRPAVGKKKTTEQAGKAAFPAQLTWSEEIVWQLLAEVEKTENRKVLLGTRSGENTSGDTKNTVYGRIGKAFFPELYEADHVLLASRVKEKFEGLCNTYKKHKKRLLATGGGLRAEDEGEGEGEGEREGEGEGEERAQGGSNTSEFLTHYIPWSGPNEETPIAAKNLWEAITKEFPFFPTLHSLLAERASVSPIAITTGVGPVGRRTVHLQPLDNVAAADADVASAAPAPAAPRSFGNDATNSSGASAPASRSSQAPRPSTNMAADQARLRSAFKPVSKKRGMDAVLINALKESHAQNLHYRQQEALRADRAQLLEEFKAGVWTKEEYQKMLKKLVGDSNKRPRLSAESVERREPSPEWQAEQGDLPTDEEDV